MAVDDYFFALLISFPSIYPAPQQIAIRANNASYEIVIISKYLLSVTTAQFTIYVDWACTPRLESNRPTVLGSAYLLFYIINQLLSINTTTKTKIQVL